MWNRVPSEDFYVPHLQRLSPDGRELVSYDADKGVLRFHDARGGSGQLRELTVAEMGGHVLQLRWSADGSALIMMTTQGLFRVPPSATSGTTTATPLFSADRDLMLEARALREGVVLHVQPRQNKRRALWFVPLDPASPPVRLTPSGRDVETFTTLSGRRVVAELAGVDGGTDVLQTIRVGKDPKVLRAERCAAPEKCTIVNWTERAGGYAYATQRCPGPRETGVCKQARVHVVQDASGAALPQTSEPLRSRYSGFPRKLSQLWGRQQGYVVAGGSRLVTWSETEEPWLWRPPKDTARSYSWRPAITTTAIDPGTDDILAAAGLRVYRVKDRKARRQFSVRDVKKDDRRRTIDGLVALPNGDIAYQLIDTWERPADVFPFVKVFSKAPDGYPEHKRAVEQLTRLSEACFRPALERSLGARGRLRLRVVVHPKGDAFVFTVDDSAAKKLSRTADCLVREIADTPFPGHNQPGLVGFNAMVQLHLTAPRD